MHLMGLLETASEAAPTPVTISDVQPVIDAITAQISVSTIVGVLASLVTVVIGMVFMWWAVRKGSKMIFSAFRGGKASV